MKLKSLSISEVNYDVFGEYHAKKFFNGTATFEVRGSKLEVHLPLEAIQAIVAVISSTVLHTCEVIGTVGYRDIEASAINNILEHEDVSAES